MQFAKDSFYRALRVRLTSVNPARVVGSGDGTRPGVIVAENEVATSAEPLPEAFYIFWGAARIAKAYPGAPRPLIGLECSIAYRTAGSSDSGVDRGRKLAAMDSDLLAICSPTSTAKLDYSQTPSADLGTNIFWTTPDLSEIEALGGETPSNWRQTRISQGPRLQRVAALTVFFYPEAQRA